MHSNGLSSLLKILFGLFIALTMPLLSGWLSTSPYEEESEPLTQMARAPASIMIMAIPQIPKKIPELVERTKILNVGCEPFLQVYTSSKIRQISLQTPTCFKNATNLQLINRTNGFTGDLLAKGQHTLISDYIHLNQGENRIFLNYQLTDGQEKSVEIQISRRDE